MPSCLHVYCKECLEAAADGTAHEERHMSLGEACGTAFAGGNVLPAA